MLVVFGIILVLFENLERGQALKNGTDYPVRNDTSPEVTSSRYELSFYIGPLLGCILLIFLIASVYLSIKRLRRQPRLERHSTRSMMYREAVSPSFMETLRESMNSSFRTLTLSVTSLTPQLPSYEEAISNSQKENDTPPPPYCAINNI